MTNPRPKFVIACIVGTRPNFVKIAPITRALNAHAHLEPWLIHTGQHYDVKMSSAFFAELDIPHPDVNLEVGSSTASQQSATIMTELEKVWTKRRPDMVLVVGDVTSTFAAALVAVRMDIPIVHVESGLRSGDRAMPEEINRILTDAISDRLLTSERSARANLNAEGIPDEKIRFVGNVMIDSLLSRLDHAVSVKDTLEEQKASAEFMALVKSKGYALVTLHRPSNVDDPTRLKELLETLSMISQSLPVIFPMHPRTRGAVDRAGYNNLLTSNTLFVAPPATYLKMIGLMKDAMVVITDSGGIQEETTALGVPCLTVRDSTERPITVTQGTNIMIDGDLSDIHDALADIKNGQSKRGKIPELWDGSTAVRVADEVYEFLSEQSE